MNKYVVAFGLIAISATAAAQETAVSEADVRCKLFSECKIAGEKKFSLGTISNESTSTRATPIASTRITPVSIKSAKTRYRPESPRPAVGVRAASTRTALDMMLTFDHNSAELTPATRRQAEVFATVLLDKAATAGRFTIEGHTDSIGSAASNRDLSRRRAQSVVSYLVERGVPANKLQAVGYGYGRPRAGLIANDPGNRRVEIVKN